MVLFRSGPSASAELRAEPMTRGGAPLPMAWRSKPGVLAPGLLGTSADAASLLYADPRNRLVVADPVAPGSAELGDPRPLLWADATPIDTGGVAGHAGRLKLVAADFDHDGDTDLLVGIPGFVRRYLEPGQDRMATAAVLFFENTGDESEPRFEKPEPITHADGNPIEVHRHVLSPSATDLDGDGELDLIAADDEGRVLYFFRDELSWEPGG